MLFRTGHPFKCKIKPAVFEILHIITKYLLKLFHQSYKTISLIKF